MALTREQMDRILDDHFDCEASDDVAGVLRTLTPDVVHDVVGAPTGPTFGKEEAGRFYEAAFQDLKVSGHLSEAALRGGLSRRRVPLGGHSAGASVRH